MQLNCYPQIGSISPNATPQTGDSTLTWFQYLAIVANNQVTWQIQYWANNAHSYQEGPPKIVWPPGYTPNPPNTTPWLPVFPGDPVTGTTGGSAPSNRIPAGSVITIQLATDAKGNVTGAQFSITDPTGVIHQDSTKPWQQYAGVGVSEPPQYALYPIYGFQVDVVSPPGGNCTFTSGTGILTYSVSPGVLSVQTVNNCGGMQPGTAENSNAFYGDVTPPSGSTVQQTLNVLTSEAAIPTIGGVWVLVQGSGFFVTGTINNVYISYYYNNAKLYAQLNKGFEWYIPSDTDLWVLVPPLDDSRFGPIPPTLIHPPPAPITTTIQTAFIELYTSDTPPASPYLQSKIIYEYLPRVETVSVNPVLWTGQASPASATLTVITPPNQSVPITLSATPGNVITYSSNVLAVPAGGNEPPVANFVINTLPTATPSIVTVQACVPTTPTQYNPCSSVTTQVSSGDIALLVISSTPYISPFGPTGALASGETITFGIYLRTPTPSAGPVKTPVLNISWTSGSGRFTSQQAPVFGNSLSSTTFILTPFVTSGFQATLSISVSYADQGSSNTITLAIAKPIPIRPPPPPPGGQV